MTLQLICLVSHKTFTISICLTVVTVFALPYFHYLRTPDTLSVPDFSANLMLVSDVDMQIRTRGELFQIELCSYGIQCKSSRRIGPS